MAAAQIRGFQGTNLADPERVLACAKHFAGYGAADGGRDYDPVYLSEAQRLHTRAAVDLIKRLVDYHLEHPERIPSSYRDTDADEVTQVVDYVAGMTDRFALQVHDRLFGLSG